VTRVVVVTGTGTEVGKTWVGAALLRALRDRGEVVAARKPVQSFEPGAGPTDAEVLAAATGQEPEEVCPAARSYELAMAPPVAARDLGRPVPLLAELVREVRWPAGTTTGLVEGVGGPRSPLAGDGDTVDLAAALDPAAVVLVADAGLGTINAIRLCLPALAQWPTTVVLNRFDAADRIHATNRAWLEDEGVDPVVGVEPLAERVVSAR
jgi:dethiobiotin synthetase